MHTELHPSFGNSDAAIRAANLTADCVHCGFCLATCPTYLDTRDERDSPRGRIYLVRQLLETGEASEQTHTHLDRCLSCRNCETTCPSGMQYGALLDIGRGLMEDRAPRPVAARAWRWLLRSVLSRAALFGPALRLGQLLRPLLPAALRDMIPARQARTAITAAVHPRIHPRKMLILEGCIQAAASPETNRAARRVLDKLGISLLSAAAAGCCGAVNYHLGAHRAGLDNMRRNIDAWWPEVEGGVEAIISSASGCGSLLADYGELLAADPQYAVKAARISTLHRDLSQVLTAEDLNLLDINTDIGPVAVQIPCSQQHALGLPGAVPELLSALGFELAATTDSHLCCGSAGTYSILQRERSLRLRDNKLAALSADRPAVIATANVGCQLHLQSGSELPVRHWIELLDC